MEGAWHKSFRGERESQRRQVEPQRQPARQRQRLESRQSPRAQKLTSFSRSTFFVGGSFLFGVIFPPHEHLARFHEVFRKLRVLCIRKHFHFPSDNEEKFCEVESCQRGFDGNYLLVSAKVRCAERTRERLEQFRINFLGQGLSLCFFDMGQKTLPEQICVF